MNGVITPTKKFNASSTGVTATDGTTNVLSNVYEIKIQKGLGVVIPGRFKLLLKLLSAVSTELPDVAEVYFGYKTPDDPRRVVPIGSMILYQPFGDLSTAQQQDSDFEAAVSINLGHEIVPLIEDETLVIQVYSTAAADVTYCEFYIPYTERTPEELVKELAWRRAWWGR